MYNSAFEQNTTKGFSLHAAVKIAVFTPMLYMITCTYVYAFCSDEHHLLVYL